MSFYIYIFGLKHIFSTMCSGVHYNTFQHDMKTRHYKFILSVISLKHPEVSVPACFVLFVYSRASGYLMDKALVNELQVGADVVLV